MESVIKWQTGEINDDGCYLVTDREGRVYVLWYRKGSIFSDSPENVIAWYPLIDIVPYKKETMEEIRTDIPKGYEFAGVDKQQVVFTKIQPRYPKTYEECCEIMGIEYPVVGGKLDGLSASTYRIDQIRPLIYLLICRDAYWEIAGEQMGLGKPWEPDWADTETDKYVIEIVKNTITIHDYPWNETNHLLTFPTPEIRNTFYENFKDLIGQCKELL